MRTQFSKSHVQNKNSLIQKNTFSSHYLVFDSSAKQPYGIIDGHTRHLGSFDQCYRIDVRIPEHIQGRYCLVDYKYEQRYVSPNFPEHLDFEFDPNDSIWEAIKVYIYNI